MSKYSREILEGKQRLPLPELMSRLGLGGRAKKSARCPFHNDKHNSFSAWQSNGVWRWKCHAGCGGGDEINFLELHENLSRRDATKRFLELAGFNGADCVRPSIAASVAQERTATFDWDSCVRAFTDKLVERLAKWRGYSIDFCRWLKESELVGLYNGYIAFPVHHHAGNVVATHYRMKDGTWRYYPEGTKVRPLIIGELVVGDPVHLFESYWDAFAFMDKSGERNDVIVTRGASNGASTSGLISENSTVFVWTQNDDAGEKWQRDVCTDTKIEVKRVKIPAPHKDVNEWTLNGETSSAVLWQALVQAKAVVPSNGQPPSGDNSLNSRFLPFTQLDDYPEPLEPAAFHGLAGEIVRHIEPHTEADPVALLFQLLAAFGNLIGHDHYIVADGARHYLNLYGVLVGQSSKGRKGTAWNHIANLMERVDLDWRQERIAGGLSSGEGLISAVHDPIEEMRPIRGTRGRHKDDFELVIAELGEDDKRLFVIESEFANVLKVMRREGNTLSMIIRSAWDSGDLRTMVKNSPLKASKAHISIIGHITRDELRRLLSQTESANGFANRFCWLAVKRSKCLPDGGAIHTVNFDDVVAKLDVAVNFAKDFVEISRDPEAKKLWGEDYPDLSEGKPGMLGAITGRAEAQVMRLSAIYALLDKSCLVRPEHHRAAIALWSYCEESCRWIFGTSTGDRNADKILAALRHAPNGMTKTEISVEVFNRHMASSDIDEALRLLHGFRMVSCRTEASGGAPVQRWFFAHETCEKSE